MKIFNSCRLLHFSPKEIWSTHFPMTLKYFLICWCYFKCQNISVNILVDLLEALSFRLRCPSFLLSKFASNLKLIQSMVRVRILGIYVASSIIRVLLSGFFVSRSPVPSPRMPVQESWVLQPHVPGSKF